MVFTSRNWFVMEGPVAIILTSWNVIFIWETCYWTRAMKKFALFDLLKSLYSDTKIFRNIFRLCRKGYKRWIFTQWKCIKISGQKQKCQKYLFINVWRKKKFDIHFTEFGVVMTTVLPVLFKYCYKYCYSDSRKLCAVMKAGDLAH